MYRDDHYYFRSSDAKCHACDTASRTAVFVGLLLSGLVCAGIFGHFVQREELPKHKLLRKVVLMAKGSARVFVIGGMRNKLKCATSWTQ